VPPSVRVDSYNIEVQDEDGFLGDKARWAFADILDKWRKVPRKLIRIRWATSPPRR
jgi:hypothetical protein